MTVRRVTAALLSSAALVTIAGCGGDGSPEAPPVAVSPSATKVHEPKVPEDQPSLFAADSIWNAALADDAPVDPTSPSRMAALNAEIGREEEEGIGPYISESEYSTPIYTVSAATARVPVTLDAGPWADSLRAALEPGVPIPRDARPAPGTDGHMTIYQPATDKLWEFWRAVRAPDGWHASWGGAMREVSASPGYYSRASWPGLASGEGDNWGSTATSLPVVAGTVTIEELRRGSIGHALAFALPDTCAGVFAWPAQRTDGESLDPACIPAGAHLRLDPALNLSRLHLPRITRLLAEAAQTYGIVVRDRTHHAVGFYAEDPAPTGSDPYDGPRGLYGGLHPWDFLPPFPWDRLQLLDMSLCQTAPCAPPGT